MRQNHYLYGVVLLGFLLACNNQLSDSLGIGRRQSLQTEFAGSTDTPGYQDGPIGSALFRSPRAFSADSSGNIYIADTGNNAIRKITPEKIWQNSQVSTFIGNQTTAAHTYTLEAPTDVVIDSDGTMYIADKGRILQMKGNSIKVLLNQGIAAPYGLRLRHYKDADMFATKEEHEKLHSKQKIIQEMEAKYGKKPFFSGPDGKINKGAKEWADKDHSDFDRSDSHDKIHKKYGDHTDLTFQDGSHWRIVVLKNGEVVEDNDNPVVKTIMENFPDQSMYSSVMVSSNRNKVVIYMLDPKKYAIYRWAKGNSSS